MILNIYIPEILKEWQKKPEWKINRAKKKNSTWLNANPSKKIWNLSDYWTLEKKELNNIQLIGDW